MIETITNDFSPQQIGYFAAGLVVAVVILWRAISSLVTRMMDKSDALLASVLGEQAKTTAALTDSVHRVETAIVKSDTANVAALGAIKDSVTAAISRLDKHEDRIDALDGALTTHGHRIQVLEKSSTRRDSRGSPRTPR